MHSDRCGSQGSRPRVAAPGQWALQGCGFLEDSGCVILEPPGTTGFSSGCTCCWRPVICRGLVLSGLCQSWREKQSRVRSCPFYVFGLVPLWVNGESCFQWSMWWEACPYVLGRLPHELALFLF